MQDQNLRVFLPFLLCAMHFHGVVKMLSCYFMLSFFLRNKITGLCCLFLPFLL